MLRQCVARLSQCGSTSLQLRPTTDQGLGCAVPHAVTAWAASLAAFPSVSPHLRSRLCLFNRALTRCAASATPSITPRLQSSVHASQQRLTPFRRQSSGQHGRAYCSLPSGSAMYLPFRPAASGLPLSGSGLWQHVSWQFRRHVVTGKPDRGRLGVSGVHVRHSTTDTTPLSRRQIATALTCSLTLLAGGAACQVWAVRAEAPPPAPSAASGPLHDASAERNRLVTRLKMQAAAALEEALVQMRGAYLALLFAPALMTAPLVFYFGIFRQQWLSLLRWTLERAGPAFIKWGQWSSTRPDLFPPDICESLELLQTAAPQHSAEYSIRTIEAAFGRPLYQLFDEFEERPVASGSIAQIHRARLSAGAAGRCGCRRGTTVAVKVRHPGVTTVMQRDFVLMQRIAAACAHLPWLSELRLEESVRQFGGPLKEQLDLSVEASHLDRFRVNFRLWPTVSFPRPIRPFVSPDVLVESFEHGELISVYVNGGTDGKNNTRLAELGMNLYLQMLLKDNFIHADLHPGNILVREVDVEQLKGMSYLLGRWFEYEPNLVLLDVGMIAELSEHDQANLIRFFKALTRQDGAAIADAMLSMSEAHTCKTPDAFVADMTTMFETLDPEYIRKYTAKVFQDMIECLRTHHVTLRSTVSTVVVTTLVLEGWASKLDPELRILDTMREILATDWSSRIAKAVDRIMTTGTLAV